MLFFRYFFPQDMCVFKKSRAIYICCLMRSPKDLFIDWNRERAKLFCLNVQIMTYPLVLLCSNKAVGGQYHSAVV